MGLRGDIESQTELSARKASDATMKQNAENAENVGLEVRVTRTYDGVGLSGGRECQWCLDRCGEDMTLEQAYQKRAFERHVGCGCEISYTNKKGITRIQNWSGGRESWIQDKDIERRKQYGIEPTEGPARHEMVKRMIKGQGDPSNQGIIAERILKKEYPLQVRHQKYLQHVKGTPQYENALKGRGRPQSFLIISEIEAQDIVYNCAGQGIIRNVSSPDLVNCEFITLDKAVGKYYEKGDWHYTKRIQIMYSKSGTHIVPVKEL